MFASNFMDSIFSMGCDKFDEEQKQAVETKKREDAQYKRDNRKTIAYPQGVDRKASIL